MNKLKMSEFLKYISNMTRQSNINYQNQADCKRIYFYLTKIGINDNNNIDIDKEGLFDKWIEYYNNKDNINVFVSPNWNYFCQFTNIDHYAKDYIKIYVPTKHEYIFENAKILFDYLSKNNIAHLSKIGKHIRFDNIVIRVGSKEEANRIISFITNNRQLQKGLINPNPFAFTMNNLAITIDGQSSYNSTIANYIGMYIQDKKEKYDSTVDADDFINYLKTFYKDVFINHKRYDECKNYFGLDFNTHNNYKNEIRKVNLKDITELIIKIYENKYNYEDLIRDFNQKNNTQYVNKEIEKLKENNRNRKVDINALLGKYYSSTVYKCNVNDAIINLINYLNTGDINKLNTSIEIKNMINNSSLREELINYFKTKNYKDTDIFKYLSYNAKNYFIKLKEQYHSKRK